MSPRPRTLIGRSWAGWLAATLGYLVLAMLATWPVVTRFGVDIPGELTDPLEHLWIMRWLRSCLIAGRNPLFCPEIQAPVGVPLGAFPTLHLQTVLYILGRLMTGNDAAIFGVIWFAGFVATGLAAFGLARWALGEACSGGVAWVAGLGVMLCGPMLMHAHGHLETMQLGVVPPFLIAWIRFVDRPGWTRLGWAFAAYLLITAAAPYFAVLAIFPAVWYLGWQVLTSERGERWPQVWRLAPWLAGFGLIVLPGVATLFGGQIWAAWQGYPMTRTRREFDLLGAPVWSSIVPSPRHLLGRLVVPDLFTETGFAGRMTEVSSYLGLVTLGLLASAAGKRVVFPRRGYWWSVLALMIVMSWGSRQEVFGASVSLPAGWIYGLFPPFHLIRVPARFNLFAAAVAVVPVAAGLAYWVGQLRSLPVRRIMLATVAATSLVDLAMVPFRSALIPAPPSLYADLKRSQPMATVLDAPLFDSTQGQTFSSLWGYWQQVTGVRTSGGYPGLTNTQFDAEVVRPSAFAARRWQASQFDDFGLDGRLDVLDRVWLELTSHGFDQVVLHDKTPLGNAPLFWINALVPRIDGRFLRPEDAPDSFVIRRDGLAPPVRLTWMADRGWRRVPLPPGTTDERFAALPEAQIQIYQPAEGSVVLNLQAVEAFRQRRVVRVLAGDRQLTSWTIAAGVKQDLRSPPIVVPVGRQTWTVRSDGADGPIRSADRLDDAGTPFSFRLSGVRMVADESASAVR